MHLPSALQDPTPHAILRHGGAWLAVLFAAFVAHLLATSVVVRLFRKVAARTSTRIDDVVIEHGVLQRLAGVAPALVIHAAAPLLFPEGSEHVFLVRRLALVWMILAAGRAASALLESLVTIARQTPGTRDKPVRSYVQVAQILLWLAVGIFVVATLMQRSPWALLTGLGAMTAILLLVFKDSILGFVASIQIAANDMVRVGDWISMESYRADGDVIDIGLHTVKVQNWDKTISTIPTPAFLSDSFKNWRGMTESGGRRIKRSLAIDMRSVRFLDEGDIERLRAVQLLQPYLQERTAEVAAWNHEHDIDTSEVANGRRMTNLGTLRAYLEAYLHAHPDISDEMTFLVRQLAPGPQGVPIEIYVFSSDQRWTRYEAIVGDIFDHFLAVLPTFDLRPFQQPTGADLEAIAASA